MKNKKVNKVFKQTLKTFLKEVMDSCDSFIDDIDDCETYDDLRIALKDNAGEILDRFGIECEECEEKKDEIENLKKNMEYYEDKYIELENKFSGSAFVPKTLSDIYKIEAFIRNKDKYSVDELESLLD